MLLMPYSSEWWWQCWVLRCNNQWVVLVPCSIQVLMFTFSFNSRCIPNSQWWLPLAWLSGPAGCTFHVSGARVVVSIIDIHYLCVSVCLSGLKGPSSKSRTTAKNPHIQVADSLIRFDFLFRILYEDFNWRTRHSLLHNLPEYLMIACEPNPCCVTMLTGYALCYTEAIPLLAYLSPLANSQPFPLFIRQIQL